MIARVSECQYCYYRLLIYSFIIVIAELDKAKNQFVSVTEDTALKQKNLSILPQIRKHYDDNGRYTKDLSLIRYLQLDFQGKSIQAKANQFERLFIKSLGIKIPTTINNQQMYEQKLVVAESFDVLKQQYIDEPTIVEQALENPKSALPKLIANRDLGGLIHNANRFVNYLQESGFNTLVEAERILDNQVRYKGI